MARALISFVPMKRGHPDDPPSDMATGQDTKTAIGPGYQGLSLRSPCAYPVTCHPSPEDLEDILKEGRMIKRCRKIEQGDLFIERKRMHIVGTQSCGRREHERQMEVAGCTGEFRTGQSVLHWWAGWFETFTKPPKQLKKKGRPVWYDATILLELGLRHVTYAGLPWHRHCYKVH